MNTALIKFISILCVCAAVAAGTNYLSYQAIIQISQAQLGSVPGKLILEVLFSVVFHIFLLSVVPLALSAMRKHIASYVVLAITSSLYMTLMTGINVVGPAITVIILCVLAFYGYKKSQDIYNYFRAQ